MTQNRRQPSTIARTAARTVVRTIARTVARGVVHAAAAAALLGACGGPESAPAEAQAPDGFAAFQAQAYREPGSGLYIVDGDTPLRGDEALRRFYDQHVAPAWAGAVGARTSGLAVIQSGGRDIAQAVPQRYDLSYCVSTSFGDRYATVVQAMREAAAAWEDAADVRFRYDSSQDGACSASNSAVYFDVNPAPPSPPYTARAFFPHYGRADRNVLIAPFSHPVITLAGVLRHELGHTLGFVHEHTRPEAGTCFESSGYRALTSYDGSSVMHYPQCNGTQTGDLVITASDQMGAMLLYGAPGAIAAASSPGVTAVYRLAADQSVQQRTLRAGWDSWFPLGAPLTSEPAVAVTQDNRWFVFARGRDAALWMRVWSGGGWGGWTSLGGVLTSAPAAAVDGGGRVHVFVRATDGSIAYRVLDGGAWSGWLGLGGGCISAPAALRNEAGGVDVFVLGTDAAMHYRNVNGPWTRLGGSFTSAPSATMNETGRRRVVFARGGDGALWHAFYDYGWSGWYSLGGGLRGGPGATVNHNGDLDIYVKGTDSRVYHRAYHGGWLPWTSID